jgi:dinuclear metal center YbgI/SA1388 family protein
MWSVDSVCSLLAQIAPLRLAESWDNVGLLVGNRDQPVDRLMTCLTISPNVVDEAIDNQVNLIVTHHPLPFKSLQRITSDTVTGAMLLRLIASQVAIYSAHTAFDSADGGINQMWADRLGLAAVEPLMIADEASGEGAGRVGRLPAATTLGKLIADASNAVHASSPRVVGDANQPVTKVALACGSGGSFLSAAIRKGCDALITGEASFHTCLEAESRGIGLGLLGHYWSERFAMERLAEKLSVDLTGLTIWPSHAEHDPIVALDRN